MLNSNSQARGILHSRISEALKAGRLKNPLEDWLAFQLVEAGFMLDNTSYVDFMLDSIDYGDAQCVESIESVDTIHYGNHTNLDQEEVLKRSESTTDKTAFTFSEGIKVGVTEKATVTIGIEKLAKMGIELTYSTEFNFQTQQSISMEKSKTFEVQSIVKIPKHSKITAKIMIHKVSFNGTFNAHYVPVWTAAGREQLIKQINFFKEYEGESLEPLKLKKLAQSFTDINMRISCMGSLDGIAGRDITVEVTESPD
jgi:hypothetical protein